MSSTWPNARCWQDCPEPDGYNPLENPGAARSRQSLVLDLMVRDGAITAQQAKEARGERLAFASTPFPIAAPHFVMWVQGQVEEAIGTDVFTKGGLRVTTTLDLNLQQRAEGIIRRRLALLQPCTGSASENAECDSGADRAGGSRTLRLSPWIRIPVRCLRWSAARTISTRTSAALLTGR